MVTYNPKDWFSLIFKFHKSDTFRILVPVMIGITLYCAVFVYVFQQFFEDGFKGTTVIHSLLGFVISLLLVFRTNTAYERWWEGRKAWGALVNNTRNLALKLHSILPPSDKKTRAEFSSLITNYPFALKEHLRGNNARLELKINDEELLNDLNNTVHVPNAIARKLYEELSKLNKNGILSDVQFRNLNPEFQSLTDIAGICERIKKTPIPFSYSLFIKKFIFVYVMSMPLGFVSDFGYWTVAVVVLTFYVLASLELIAEEIEDPFGRDSNDLPTDDLSVTISKNIKEILNVSH